VFFYEHSSNSTGLFRLVEETEQQWFLDLLRQTTKEYFGMNLDELLKHLTKLPGTDGTPGINLHHLRRLFFGDYLSEPDADGISAYVEITDPEVNRSHYYPLPSLKPKP
jgi:hypothetical protein